MAMEKDEWTSEDTFDQLQYDVKKWKNNYFMAKDKIKQLEAENSDLVKSRDVAIDCISHSTDVMSKLGDRIKQLEEEAVKDLEVIKYYGNLDSWGKTNQSSINRISLGDCTAERSFCYRGVWVKGVEIGGKRARQRLKERGVE